ncbi:MAG TPA: MOSC domain-containing protein, partial [Gammaproteobacteria bacterium]
MLQVSQIYLYPVKSCGGCSVDGAELETRGFARDRRYMLVGESGLFLTQRTHPHMALIRLQPAEGGFLATKDGQPDLTLPPAMATGGTRRVLVWRDEVEAVVAPR